MQGVADRVVLGLLPSSEEGWPAALSALKPGGGVLHVHHNVLDTQERSWVDSCLCRLSDLAAAQVPFPFPVVMGHSLLPASLSPYCLFTRCSHQSLL